MPPSRASSPMKRACAFMANWKGRPLRQADSTSPMRNWRGSNLQFRRIAQGELNIASAGERKVVVCLYCDKQQEVGRKTLSMTYKFCNKSLRLEDLRFKKYQARRTIETCGIVTV